MEKDMELLKDETALKGKKFKLGHTPYGDVFPIFQHKMRKEEQEVIVRIIDWLESYAKLWDEQDGWTTLRLLEEVHDTLCKLIGKEKEDLRELARLVK